MSRCFITLLVVSVALLSSLTASAVRLTLAVPISKKNMLTEMSQAVLSEAARRLGDELIFEPLPQERALVNINAGVLDGDSLRSVDLDLKPYPNLVRVRVPIAYDDLVAYGIGKVFKPAGLASLKPYKVVTIRIKELEQLGPEYRFTFVASNDQAFNMLRLGRVDLAVLPRSVSCEAVHAGYNEILVQEPALEHVEFVAHLHKSHAGLAREMERTLLQMKKDGSMARIQNEVHRKWSRCNPD
jgi:polar amino acid transport system substrate-binding protein